MGLTNGKLLLMNPKKPALQPVEVNALADTGSVFLCIPGHVQVQLELEELMKKEVILADGSTKMVSYHWALLRFVARIAAIFRGHRDGRPGAPRRDPMEDMDLVVIPSTRTLDVNPANPNYACGIVSRSRHVNEYRSPYKKWENEARQKALRETFAASLDPINNPRRESVECPA